MTFLPDVDVKNVGPEKKMVIQKSRFPNWATTYILCLANTAMKWGTTKTHYKRDYKNND